MRLQDALDGQIDCRLPTVKRLMSERDELLAMLERVTKGLREEAEVRDQDNRDERGSVYDSPAPPPALILEAEALIARLKGGGDGR